LSCTAQSSSKAKMTYLVHRNRPYQTRLRAIAIACGVLILIIGLIQFLAPHFMPGLWTSIARPFWRTQFSISSGSLQTPDQLLNENENLKRQLADDQVRMQSVNALETENQELHAILGRASTTPYILAAVLKRPPYSPYDELIIDLGRNDGLSTTSLVFAPGNVLIGRVADVMSQTSKVMLLSSPGEQYQVLIGSAHTPATALGRGGGQYQAQISRDVKVSEGDFISDPSLNDKVFGIVTSVLSDPANPFSTVLFAPPVNIYELRWVLIKK
jgi:cell shape-determining protein MreC